MEKLQILWSENLNRCEKFAMDACREREKSRHKTGPVTMGDIANLTPGQIDHWLMSLKLADPSKEHVRTTLWITFRETRRERIIQSNPIDFIQRLNVVSESSKPPSME